MPYYQKLGEIPQKHHIWFHRNGAAPTYKNEGIAYEHVFTTQGFDEAYSIMYHLRPPTRVRNVKLLGCHELKKVADSPLRHHHLRTATIPRRGDLYTGRIPMLFNQDMTAYRAKPAKTYDKFEYYKNGGADEIIFVFHGGGTLESVFGKLRYRAEDYIVIPRGITYRMVPDKIEDEDHLVLESAGTVHQPPPIHQTFEIRGYVVCTFAPRMLDTHPEAVRIPWVHDNVEADEVLFYVRGNFGSRRGIESGSITLHPRGIPHGPHPGTIMASRKATRTEELAVMFDTQHTLELTEDSLALDDPKYPQSWLE